MICSSRENPLIKLYLVAAGSVKLKLIIITLKFNPCIMLEEVIF